MPLPVLQRSPAPARQDQEDSRCLPAIHPEVISAKLSAAVRIERKRTVLKCQPAEAGWTVIFLHSFPLDIENFQHLVAVVVDDFHGDLTRSGLVERTTTVL